jgi:hypothetical protein
MTKFRDCVVLGDMSSDRASEQYPEGPVCEDCIADELAQGEDSQIVGAPGDINNDVDAECILCGATRDD